MNSFRRVINNLLLRWRKKHLMVEDTPEPMIRVETPNYFVPEPEYTLKDGYLSGPTVKQVEGFPPQGNMKEGDPSLVVFHWTAGGSAQSSIDSMKKNGLSCHFVVDRDGTIYQLISTNQIAWHAGKSEWEGRKGCNSFSIGIEICNYGPLLWDAQQSRFENVYGSRIDDGKVWREKVGQYEYWEKFTPEQIEACKNISRALRHQYRSLSCGTHADVSPGRKIDIVHSQFPVQVMRDLLSSPQ